MCLFVLLHTKEDLIFISKLYTFYVEKNDSGVPTFSTYSNIPTVMKVIVCFPFTGEGTSQMSNITNITNITNTKFSTPETIPIETPCPKTIHNITQFVLARLKVKREKSPCEGRLYLYFPDQRPAPLCVNNHLTDSWWNELCKDMRCGDYKGFKTSNKASGHDLTGNMTLISKECAGLQIICEGTL